jgi:hypothetical protein
MVPIYILGIIPVGGRLREQDKRRLAKIQMAKIQMAKIQMAKIQILRFSDFQNFKIFRIIFAILFFCFAQFLNFKIRRPYLYYNGKTKLADTKRPSHRQSNSFNQITSK